MACHLYPRAVLHVPCSSNACKRICRRGPGMGRNHCWSTDYFQVLTLFSVSRSGQLEYVFIPLQFRERRRRRSRKSWKQWWRRRSLPRRRRIRTATPGLWTWTLTSRCSASRGHQLSSPSCWAPTGRSESKLCVVFRAQEVQSVPWSSFQPRGILTSYSRVRKAGIFVW